MMSGRVARTPVTEAPVRNGDVSQGVLVASFPCKRGALRLRINVMNLSLDSTTSRPRYPQSGVPISRYLRSGDFCDYGCLNPRPVSRTKKAMMRWQGARRCVVPTHLLLSTLPESADWTDSAGAGEWTRLQVGARRRLGTDVGSTSQRFASQRRRGAHGG